MACCHLHACQYAIPQKPDYTESKEFLCSRHGQKGVLFVIKRFLWRIMLLMLDSEHFFMKCKLSYRSITKILMKCEQYLTDKFLMVKQQI
jgi:hypothetical protein